jgi:hypothetical protein
VLPVVEADRAAPGEVDVVLHVMGYLRQTPEKTSQRAQAADGAITF